jgi:hypothetical protein
MRKPLIKTYFALYFFSILILLSLIITFESVSYENRKERSFLLNVNSSCMLKTFNEYPNNAYLYKLNLPFTGSDSDNNYYQIYVLPENLTNIPIFIRDVIINNGSFIYDKEVIIQNNFTGLSRQLNSLSTSAINKVEPYPRTDEFLLLEFDEEFLFSNNIERLVYSSNNLNYSVCELDLPLERFKLIDLNSMYVDNIKVYNLYFWFFALLIMSYVFGISLFGNYISKNKELIDSKVNFKKKRFKYLYYLAIILATTIIIYILWRYYGIN